jgi:hypothetical protein
MSWIEKWFSSIYDYFHNLELLASRFIFVTLTSIQLCRGRERFMLTCNRKVIIFTVATTLCRSLPLPWFR